MESADAEAEVQTTAPPAESNEVSDQQASEPIEQSQQAPEPAVADPEPPKESEAVPQTEPAAEAPSSANDVSQADSPAAEAKEAEQTEAPTTEPEAPMSTQEEASAAPKLESPKDEPEPEPVKEDTPADAADDAPKTAEASLPSQEVAEPELKTPPLAPSEAKAEPVAEPPKVPEKQINCGSCGANVTGLKFCGECGTKVPPQACLVCSTDLIPRAKFCPECGTARGSKERPVDEPEPEPLSTASSTKRNGIASVKLVDGANTSPEKKTFSVKQSPKCAVCGKSVYETERAVDSQGTVFHKDCFKCKTCRVHLTGRQKVNEPETGTVKLATGQYLVAREGSDIGQQGELFCDKHAFKVRSSIVKAKAVDEIARNDSELDRVASLRKEKNEEARSSMQIRVGDMLPTCARCGLPIDKGQKAFTTGIQKMHEVCPTKEESDAAIRTTRYFVRKAPDRLAATLTCDKETKHPHTFLFELDKSLLNEQLKKTGNEAISLQYVPDSKAHTAANRKLVAPSSDAAREFDLTFKDFFEFSFQNPKDNDKVVKPSLNKATKTLTVTKFYHTNGVLQTVAATFKYEESSRLCSAERIDVTLEMWPPEAAAEMAAQLNPLADLKKGDASADAKKDAPGSSVQEQPISKDSGLPPLAPTTNGRPSVAPKGKKSSTKQSNASDGRKGSCMIM